MFFSQVAVKPGYDPKLSQIMNRDSYYLHQMLWKLFPEAPHIKRDFIYRIYNDNNFPYFYIVSARQPKTNQDFFSIKTKPYFPKIYSGNRYAFSLEVNPVIKRKNSRHDIVMDKKYHSKKSGDSIINEAGLEWLESRSEKYGFTFDRSFLKIKSYVQHKIIKPNASKPICFSTLDYSGILTVTNPVIFLNALYHGIGKCKAFGCGLIILLKKENNDGFKKIQ